MKKIILTLIFFTLFCFNSLVTNAIEFKTLPTSDQNSKIISMGSEYTVFKEGVIVYFTNNDSLQYFNGTEWVTYSEYSRAKYGQPGKIIALNDELFILKYPKFEETGTIYKINNEGKVEEIPIKFDIFNSATSFGDKRNIRDFDVDANGNIYVITNFGIIENKEIVSGGIISYSIPESVTEYLITNQKGEIIEYNRNLFTSYPYYNTRESLTPKGSFDKIKVTQNGNVYLTGLSFTRQNLPFWELSQDGWKNIDFGFKKTNLDNYEPNFIQELNGNVYLSHFRNLEGVLFELKNGDWISYGKDYIDSDVIVQENSTFDVYNTLRFSELVEINSEIYSASQSFGIMKINKDEFVSYPLITENGVKYLVSGIINAKNSLWVIYFNSKIENYELRLIDPAGLITSIEDDVINTREILSIEFYDLIGKQLTETEINTGIPHIKFTRYKDGGFRGQKILINE